MNLYTVIYTTSNQWGTLVHSPEFVRIPTGEKLEKILNNLGICMSQVVVVFPGWHECITTDWSKIKGE
jgi:hypothetical protein